ncbi:MAG: endonuclease III domain-containing protein [Promethearchaeota archaeon]
MTGHTWSLSELYDLLYTHYGPQGWWPLINLNLQNEGVNPTLRGTFTGYHPTNYALPRTEEEIFEVMIGAILAQNTSWTNADKALGNLHSHNMLSLSKIRRLSHEELGLFIRSSGFFNQKAQRITDLCSFLLRHPISELTSMETTDLRSKLLILKGVGPETADSMLLYGLKKPSFVIDAYTRRLLHRLGVIVEYPFPPYEVYQQKFHAQLAESVDLFNEYHALIVQHCVHVCSATPRCSTCFLSEKCPKLMEPRKPRRKPKKKSNKEN